MNTAAVIVRHLKQSSLICQECVFFSGQTWVEAAFLHTMKKEIQDIGCGSRLVSPVGFNCV